jgi:hypothetical protein
MSLSYQWIPFVLSAVIFLSAGSCSEENESRAPEISSFEPAGALAGAQVVVTGDHFSPAPGDNTVMFNGTAASIVSATKTQLTVTVPAAATTGKISVTTGTLTATSAHDFELLKDIPRDGLVGFYTFSDGALDNSGYNLHGTVNGATLTADRFGNSSHAYQFDGVDDFITMGNPVELQISEIITVSAWVKIDEFEESMAILSKGDSQTGSPEGYVLQLAYQSGQTVVPGYRFYTLGTQSGVVKTAINFVEGEWVFLAFSMNTGSYRFFIDQSKSIAGNGYKPLTSGLLGDFVIGRDENGANHLKGAVDDVIVYNRLLTEDEIRQLYAQTVSKY